MGRPMRAVRLLTLMCLLLTAVPGAQIDPRSALIERGAWAALNAGRARAAADGFRDALAADPKNARLHLGRRDGGRARAPRRRRAR